MPRIKIITEGSTIEIENETVANVADLLREVAPMLNISNTANVAVNGVPAALDTPLYDDDEVTTTKPAGTKGA